MPTGPTRICLYRAVTRWGGKGQHEREEERGDDEPCATSLRRVQAATGQGMQ
ncbi:MULTISPECIES: hypothetical protein [unclassified Brevibacterium]|uniref:hypothetical protein n=1 Tax=unclassified Brevibacterium TaxID=2614124 RepID=UPI001E294630|nr:MULTISPECIES: hypothetical protein [unclassified Brevibacterium]MDK8434979.1 hypothetical protein [Brevibacterium sp. H-BE7]